MATELQVCPGDSLSSFIRAIAYDLKRRRIEYFIVAYFDAKGFPLAMREIPGRTSWVGYSTSDVIVGARQSQASGICLVHNHPVGAGESPSLRPSTQDIRSQLEFLSACHENGLNYLGSWIVSKGQISEVLCSAREMARQLPSSQIEFDASKLSWGITPEFVATVDSLTKPSVFESDWYNIGIVKMESGTPLTVRARVIYAIADKNFPMHDVLVTLKDLDGREYTAMLSVEEVSRACYGLADLYAESRRLSERQVEYAQLSLPLGDNCKFGIFQVGIEQTGTAEVRGEFCRIKMKDFPELQRLFQRALEKLESLVA